MKKIAIAAAVVLSASAVYAAELNGVSASDISKLSALKAPAPVLRAVQAPSAAEINDLTLLPQASKSLLSTYAKTEADFKAFTGMWTPILAKYGMKVTGTEYKDQFGILKYESPDGRVVRDFVADKMDYDALSPDAMAKLQQDLVSALDSAGLTPIAALKVTKNDYIRPTVAVYYLTKPDENMDHEVQLRQLKNGDDIDFDLLANSVTLVKKDSSFSMVYIGRLVGFKTLLSKDEAGIAAKLTDYRKFLSDNKKDFIASRTFKLDEPIDLGEDGTLSYAVNVYFFQ